MEAYRSINLYNRLAITSLGVACGLVDSPFTFNLFTIYTFILTIKS